MMMMVVGDLIKELENIPDDLLEEIQFIFQRYGITAEIIGDDLVIDEEAMSILTEEERYYLYTDLYKYASKLAI